MVVFQDETTQMKPGGSVCFLLGKFNFHRNYFTKRLKINGDYSRGSSGLTIRPHLTHNPSPIDSLAGRRGISTK